MARAKPKAPAQERNRLVIEVDTVAAEDRISKMIATLARVPVAAELTAWQTEDMKRRFPNTEEINPTVAMTRIWPRSRKEVGWVKKQRPSQRRAKSKWQRPVRRFRTAPKPTHVASTRSILREELFDQLRARMADMMQREIKW